MKRILSLILTVSLMISLAPDAFAASEEAMAAANALHVIDIMKGTGADANGNPNYDLD